MKTLPLAPQGVFWTIQGEGALMGEPMAFVRLAGCSVGCRECDTNYSVAERAAVGEVIQRVANLAPTGSWVWLTGGEPTDHDLGELVTWLKRLGYKVALATSGVREVPPNWVDWISVSPHAPGYAQRHGSEVKLVLGLNGLTPEAASECAACATMFAWKWVSAMNDDPAAVAGCLEWVKAHPGWRLGVQAHKVWGLP
jgi:7-carboxy-7-deazaguanine synthase